MFHHLIAAGASQEPSIIMSLMPMILIFLVFYVVWFLPLKKKQKAVDEMIAALKKGDRVVTSGGFYGEVAKVDGDIVQLKLAENVKVRVARRAISGLAGTQEDNGGN